MRAYLIWRNEQRVVNICYVSNLWTWENCVVLIKKVCGLEPRPFFENVQLYNYDCRVGFNDISSTNRERE